MAADYSHVTLCFSLPRSRSQWIAWIYAHAASVASWHDPMKHCSSPHDLVRMIEVSSHERVFIADTSAILFHSQLRVLLPGARFLYVVRDATEVCRSIRRQLDTDAALIIEPMHRRLLERMQDAPVLDTTSYGGIEEFARDHWPDITGEEDRGDDWWRYRNMSIIDVPIRKQTYDRYKAAALLRHTEIR